MKPIKKLDNELVARALIKQSKGKELNASQAHSFIKALQETMAEELAKNDTKLFVNFVAGISNKKSKIKK